MALKVFFYSLAALFLELLLIRWISTELNVLAYLQNSVLVVCLFGFGLGFLRTASTISIRAVLLPLVLLSGLIGIEMTRNTLGGVLLGLSVFHDFPMWSALSPDSFGGSRLTPALAGGVVLLTVFLLTTQAMVPWGAVIGRIFQQTDKPRERAALYGANLIGSLSGILLFGALNFLGMPPVLWFLVFSLLMLLVLRLERSATLVTVAACLLLPLIQLVNQLTGYAAELYWTPYQKIEVASEQESGEAIVVVNNSGYQQIQDNSAANLDRLGDAVGPARGLSQYDIPSLMYPAAQEILVVGAGTGNDVAGVLRNTTARVTAVEIDPIILDIGRKLHPEHPLTSERVEIELDDARAYFERSEKKFDLIIFGLLDSHTTPNLASARLDHFVYTRQSLAAARSLLKPGGVLCLLFEPQREYIVERLSKLLSGTFGEKPLAFQIPTSHEGWGGFLFVSGDQQRINDSLIANPRLQEHLKSLMIDPKLTEDSGIQVTSDDWPYLYLKEPGIPSVFAGLLISLALVVVICSWGGGALSSSKKLGVLPASASFLLGAGFALTETYGVSRAAILFGSTWVPNTIVISSILIMAYMANLAAPRMNTRSLKVALVFLPICALACSLVSLEPLLDVGTTLRYLLSIIVFGLPLFFSGIVFSSLIIRTGSPERIMAWNLFGAIAGSLLHYLSYSGGFQLVGMIGALIYLAASLSVLFSRNGKETATLADFAG